jgi:branched-chain amino acid transport system ATP-binding protein
MTALLELDRVTKRFGQVTVADGISLTVGHGEALGIVGPNGAGKTSLFSMVSGDLSPDAGEVRFDGAAVTRTDAAARCRLGMGRTYQVPRPFEGMTVFENVLVAARYGAGLATRPAYALAAEVLDETGLAPQANHRAGALTLLQRKRLEVARALGTRPRLLLLDEVAGGLTDPEVEELVAIVHGLKARGLSIVWIEHVVRALTSTVDRLVCLAGGHVIGDGDPTAVLASDAVREVYLGTDPDAAADPVPDGPNMLGRLLR